jgi:hypothetical protein
MSIPKGPRPTQGCRANDDDDDGGGGGDGDMSIPMCKRKGRRN